MAFNPADSSIGSRQLISELDYLITWPERKEFSGQVAGWSFRGLKPWQAGADEIGEIRGITRLNGSFVNQGPGFKFRKRQVTR